MAFRLTDAEIRKLPLPPKEKGYTITFDDLVAGFGCQVTAGGTRTFIFNYRNKNGRDRRFVIGRFGEWRTAASRMRAKELRREVDNGGDPQAGRQADRTAKTVGELCDRFTETYLPDTLAEQQKSKPTANRDRLRSSTQREYAALISKDIKPELKHIGVAELTFEDVERLHRKMTRRGAGYSANRAIAVLSRMLNLAIKWHWRTDNPTKGVERNHEQKKQRYLTHVELAALTEALKGLRDQQAANIIRMLLLTGARRGETLQMRWQDIDLQAAVWTKPGATTKTRTEHRIPLSAPAVQLLTTLRAAAKDDAEYVFPGRGSPHRVDVKFEWRKACVKAGIVNAQGKPSARLHDLRHTYASVLASGGASLPIIGGLLGHTQASTTHRYSHLMDDPLRRATERAGAAVMSAGPSAEVIAFREKREGR